MNYLVAVVIFLVYLAAAWMAGTWLRLPSPSIWILRGLLAAIGAAGLGLFVWFERKRRRAPEAAEDGPTEIADDLMPLFRQANAKLGSARNAGGRIPNLPLFLVMGESGSAKSSTVVNSGLRPELLAGQVYAGTQLVPTKSGNIWFAGNAVFVEAGASVLRGVGSWRRLIAAIRPGRLSSVVAGKRQAPRAVIVCVDTESFLKPNASVETAGAARSLRSRIVEISAALGIDVPLYVIFTRFDKVPFFTEWAGTLSSGEVRQVFGATLPLAAKNEPGAWAERQTARLMQCLNELSQSVARSRVELLEREGDRSRRPAIYEFPREFRKARKLIAEFLVELSAPTQLGTGPFLRGFYFSGVRPVTVTDPAPAYAPAEAASVESSFASDATSFFRTPAAGSSAPKVMRPGGSRGGSQRVPEWTFLSELFTEVLLRDQSASALSGTSTKTGGLRKILLGSAAAICLLLLGALTVSWMRNRALEEQALAVVRDISGAPAAAQQVPPVDALRRLDRLRELASTLSRYGREGAPLSYRWGLYVSDLQPEVKRLYFTQFRRLLFGETQNSLLETLRDLPAAPRADYGAVYDTLKAYLITTTNHDRSTVSFLAPVLEKRWAANRNVDAERMALAQRQFEFYSNELRFENPYTEASDREAVTKARRYLAQFAGPERVYRAMLADAARANPAVNFNTQFPGSGAVLVDGHTVNGAFTKGGWDFMSNAIRNPDKYFAGEEWVLGTEAGAATVDRTKLAQQLEQQYTGDYVAEWRSYIKAANFVRYASLADAAKKLNVIAGNQSPLLELLSLATQNTAIKESPLLAAFAPVHAVVPPGDAQQLISAPNQNFMRGLLTLGSSLEQLAGQNPPSDAGSAQVINDAANAKGAARQTAQGFRPDPAGHIDGAVEKLMEDPITGVEALLKVLGPAELNGKGKGLCAQMRSLEFNYPFNGNASTEASAAEVNAIFRKPDGALWTFYDQNLQKLLLSQGTQYIANPTATTKVTPSFLHFFNSAAAAGNFLYPAGAQEPKFTYTLTPALSEGIQQLSLTIDGQTLTYSGGTPAPKAFTWQASGVHGVRASVRFGSPVDLTWASVEGTWAVFRFFDRADRWQYNGSKNDVEWTIRAGNNPISLPSGRPLTVRIELDMNGGPDILQRGYLTRIGCVADVAH